VWGQLGVALQSCEEQINQSAPERDPTFAGDANSYLAISRAAVQAIVPALAAATIAQPAAILDVPCGYGRVTRALRAAWPEAELVAADQSTSAVAFCVEQFAAEGWELSDYPTLGGNERQAQRFDLIWSASLLSSIDPEHLGELLSSLLSLLRPGGVLVAAYHGRDSARRFGEHPNPELRSLARSVPSRGVGFQPRRESATLGTTAMTPDWLLSHLTNRRDAMVLSVIERGWADHLDVVGVARRDIHHHQADLSAAS
jgi:SAM-dependent methyltransferase